MPHINPNRRRRRRKRRRDGGRPCPAARLSRAGGLRRILEGLIHEANERRRGDLRRRGPRLRRGRHGARAGPLQSAARMPAEERDHAAETNPRPATTRRRGRLPQPGRRRSAAAAGRDARTVRSRREKVRWRGLHRGAWGGVVSEPRGQTGACEVRGVHARKRRERARTEHLWRPDLQQQGTEHGECPVQGGLGQVQR